MRVIVISMVIGVLEMVPKKRWKESGRVGNWRTNRDHLNYHILEVSQNTKKSEETCCHLDSSEKPPVLAGVIIIPNSFKQMFYYKNNLRPYIVSNMLIWLG